MQLITIAASIAYDVGTTIIGCGAPQRNLQC